MRTRAASVSTPMHRAPVPSRGHQAPKSALSALMGGASAPKSDAWELGATSHKRKRSKPAVVETVMGGGDACVALAAGGAGTGGVASAA